MGNTIKQIAVISIVMLSTMHTATADFYWNEPDTVLCEVKEGADPLDAKEADFNMMDAMDILETHGLYHDDEGVQGEIVKLTLMRMHALAIGAELRLAEKSGDERKTGIYQEYYDTYRRKFCDAMSTIMWPS